MLFVCDLRFVVCCLLCFVVRCALLVVRCVLCVVSCVLVDECGVLFVASCTSGVVYWCILLGFYLLCFVFLVSWLLRVPCCLLCVVRDVRVVGCGLFVVCGL